MSLTDEEFRERHKPLHVPASYDQAESLQDKVVFALADISEGTAEQVIKRIEQLDPQADHKPVIATTHRILTELYEGGMIAASEQNGELVYNLHKITKANGGGTDPDKLAPGLD